MSTKQTSRGGVNLVREKCLPTHSANSPAEGTQSYLYRRRTGTFESSSPHCQGNASLRPLFRTRRSSGTGQVNATTLSLGCTCINSCL